LLKAFAHCETHLHNALLRGGFKQNRRPRRNFFEAEKARPRARD
jgi:hypothetical protein